MILRFFRHAAPIVAEIWRVDVDFLLLPPRQISSLSVQDRGEGPPKLEILPTSYHSLEIYALHRRKPLHNFFSKYLGRLWRVS